MKFSIKILLTLLLTSLTIFYSGCDDSGVIPIKNDVTTSFTNLKRLDYPSEGIYEAFIGFDDDLKDHGNEKYVSLGRFNISIYGQIVDVSGAPLILKFKDKPGNINLAADAIVTIEPANDNDTLPNGPHILGGIKTEIGDNLIFDVSMHSSHVLGNIASQFISDNARFTYATPTSLDTTDEYKGIWFCNPSNGDKTISCLAIPDSLDWLYEAFIILKSDTSQIWSLGKFSDPNAADQDGAGPYKGLDGLEWQKPGQDYLNNSPLPDSVLNTGSFRLMISLIPKTGLFSPYYLRLFIKDIVSLPYHGLGSLNNIANLPGGRISISKK
jgi:hypothetical protein